MIILTLILYVSFGVYNANTFVVKEINLTLNKVSSPVSFILISDSHIGSESPRYFKKIINQIKLMDKDFIVITGDLIDEDRIIEDDLIYLKDLDVPVYFIYGNHETYTRKKSEFFENLLIVLDNQKVFYNDEIVIIGINSYGNNSRSFNQHFDVGVVLDKVNVNTSKYNIILNQEPTDLDEIIEKQIDLQLSGHTHNGQLWPLNYIVKSIYGYSYGLYNISQNTQLYISSGVGVWGPNLRTSAKNEILKFNIN